MENKKYKLTLSKVIIFTVAASILAASTFTGVFALKMLSTNKLMDTWAILFLELERQGTQLVQTLEKTMTPVNSTSSVLQVSGENLKTVRGNFPSGLKLEDFNLKKPDWANTWTLLQYNGEDFLARSEKDYLGNGTQALILTPINMPKWFQENGVQDWKSALYVISKEGKLFFSNRAYVTSASYVTRPLVQKFIGNPLRQGQLEFKAEGQNQFGFFYEVPSTNLVLFVEVTEKEALASVREMGFKFLGVLILTLLAVSVILRFPLNAIILPLKELARHAEQVGEGKFDLQFEKEGFGEIKTLSKTFSKMANNLVIREQKIQKLLVEQQEKFRLQQELVLAQGIQDNFLSNFQLPGSSGVEVAAQYTPAAECAGDWYGYFNDDSTGESVCVVTDVSGHGAGSAMFTAIIAGCFEEMKLDLKERKIAFNLTDFAKRLNRLILKLGRGKMHATMVVAKFSKANGTIEVLNAGHPHPLLVYPEELSIKNEPIIERCDMLGIFENLTPVIVTKKFVKGTSLFLYTDGLIEGRPDHKLYGDRRLNKVCKISLQEPIEGLIQKVYYDWQNFLDGQHPQDDVCLLAMRAA